MMDSDDKFFKTVSHFVTEMLTLHTAAAPAVRASPTETTLR